MRILFTICGRAGSKGIKNKNIRDFLGKPLPYYTLSAIDLYLKETKEPVEADIVVNTDSPELIALMQNNPLVPVDVIERSADLSGDLVGKVDVIVDCMDKMQERKGYTYDMVVDCDITAPLRTAADIANLIHVQVKTGADGTTSVASARRNPYFNQIKKTENGYKLVIQSDFTCRQQAPDIYDMNASLYAYKPDFLKTKTDILDGHCEIIEMMDTGILDLDHVHDFELMEVIAKYLFEKNPEFGAIYQNI